MTQQDRIERKPLAIRRKSAGIRTQLLLARELAWNVETIVDIEQGRVTVAEETEQQIDAAIARIVERKQREEECLQRVGAVTSLAR